VAQLHAEADLWVAAPPRDIYARLADYRQQHSHVLPSAYHEYTVESGGQGAGTIVSWVLHVGNHRRPYRMQVSEPQAGELLVEQDTNSSFRNEWRVLAEGSGTRVRLSTTWEQRSHGFPAIFERLFAPRSLSRLHQETLRRLAAEVTASS